MRTRSASIRRGTGAWHVGEPPDRRAQAAARRRGADIGGQRARQVRPRDFVRFDFILAMDNANLKTLAALCPDGEEDRLRLFMNFAANAPRRDVPDPFYGAGGGFEEVLDLIESASRGLLEHVRARQLADHT